MTVLLEAIDQMEGVSTIDLLRGLLADETSATTTKITVINLLAKKSDVFSLPILVDFLDNENDDLRIAGLTAITAIVRTADKTKLEDIGLVDILKAKLPESTPRLRKAVINLFGQLKDPATIEILTGFLLDENAEIRADATMALGSFGDKKSMDLLLDRLAVEEDRWTKIQLIGALQKTREKSVIPVFIELLKDPEPDIQSSAARALGELTNHYYGENYEKWSEWWEAQKNKVKPQ
ncbi:MAG: HEAT repeat domain-containing protein [Planctomycetes bacterium]|nr:HEAT repeat domain-containing protein [Planctomycetota bacterium]